MFLFCSPFNPKQPLAVGGGGVLHLLRGQALDLGDGLGHAVNITGVTALAAVGGGGHVGGIRLDHEALQRHGGDDLRGFAGVFESDGPGEGQVPAELDEGLRVLHAAGVAVEHAPDAGELLHDGQAVSVGLPVVDDDGQVQPLRQGELGAEDLFLQVTGDLLPVVVQADLPHGLDLGVARHGLDLVQPVGRQAERVLRVDPGGGVEEGVLLGQGDGLPGAFQVTAGAQDQADVGRGQGGEDLVPVRVELLGVIMRVGIKQHGSALLFRDLHQGMPPPAVADFFQLHDPLGVGVLQVEQLLGHDAGEAGLQNALDDDVFHHALVRNLGVGVQDVLDGGAGLGGVEVADLLQFGAVADVEVLDLLLVGGGGEQLLQAVDADALLEGEDHDEEGDVDPVILAFFRGGHDLQADVVVDGRGGHGLVLGVLHGDEIQVLAQQGDDLVHVQADVRQLLPGGQLVVVQIVLPPDELVGDQLLVVAHSVSLSGPNCGPPVVIY